jgi:hypothetical protein
MAVERLWGLGRGVGQLGMAGNGGSLGFQGLGSLGGSPSAPAVECGQVPHPPDHTNRLYSPRAFQRPQCHHQRPPFAPFATVNYPVTPWRLTPPNPTHLGHEYIPSESTRREEHNGGTPTFGGGRLGFLPMSTTQVTHGKLTSAILSRRRFKYL